MTCASCSILPTASWCSTRASSLPRARRRRSPPTRRCRRPISGRQHEGLPHEGLRDGDHSMTAALTAEGLHTYYGKSHILHGVSLEAAEGQVTALLGRNGAGKTTTLRSLMGLTPPREGHIKI